MRAPSASIPTLIGKHALQGWLISGVGDDALVQLLLALVRLRCQNVPGERMIANHFARAGLLEPFGRTFMCLQLRHSNFPGSQQELFNITCRATQAGRINDPG